MKIKFSLSNRGPLSETDSIKVYERTIVRDQMAVNDLTACSNRGPHGYSGYLHFALKGWACAFEIEEVSTEDELCRLMRQLLIEQAANCDVDNGELYRWIVSLYSEDEAAHHTPISEQATAN